MGTVYEGAILTVDDDDTVMRYLVEERGRITYVGHRLPDRFTRLKRIELGERALCPSFVDTHLHLSGYALHLAGCDVAGETPSVKELAGYVQRAIDRLAARGIGMVHTACGVGASGGFDITFERWMAKSAQGGFQVRVFPQSMDIATAMRKRLPRIGGCFANALDGHLETGDAAYRGACADDGEAGPCGSLRYSHEELVRFCRDAHKANLQIQLHAVGDAAFDQAVGAYMSAMAYWPRSESRHRIVHACLPTDAGLRTCAELGVNLAMQTSMLDKLADGALDGVFCDVPVERLCPLRSIWDAGVVVSAGSDAPASEPDPIAWMHRACNHPVVGQSLTPAEALRMCTYNGYWSSFNDDERGSLESGKVADMCILSGNPCQVGAEGIADLRVEQLILGGVPYAGQQQSAVSALLMGFAGTGYC